MDLDLGMELGAEAGTATQRLMLYLPNKDKSGNAVPNFEEWVTQARELLSRIGRGSTAYPPADGTWLDDQDEVIWEQTRIIYCYIDPDRFLANVNNLREFLHRFGRETNQGEVVVEWDGRFFRIMHFDQPGGG